MTHRGGPSRGSQNGDIRRVDSGRRVRATAPPGAAAAPCGISVRGGFGGAGSRRLTWATTRSKGYWGHKLAPPVPEIPLSEQRLVPMERIERAILLLRGHRVMVDADLAALYGVSIKRLNEQVRRNIKRFPPDFMFQMSSPNKELRCCPAS